jgi:hypothetical protein
MLNRVYRLLSSDQTVQYAFRKPKNSSVIISALGLVAQSVEQRIENPCVGGSIPPRATKNFKMTA